MGGGGRVGGSTRRVNVGWVGVGGSMVVQEGLMKGGWGGRVGGSTRRVNVGWVGVGGSMVVQEGLMKGGWGWEGRW